VRAAVSASGCSPDATTRPPTIEIREIALFQNETSLLYSPFSCQHRLSRHHENWAAQVDTILFWTCLCTDLDLLVGFLSPLSPMERFTDRILWRPSCYSVMRQSYRVTNLDLILSSFAIGGPLGQLQRSSMNNLFWRESQNLRLTANWHRVLGVKENRTTYHSLKPNVRFHDSLFEGNSGRLSTRYEAPKKVLYLRTQPGAL
jgi:hypothetical protein